MRTVGGRGGVSLSKREIALGMARKVKWNVGSAQRNRVECNVDNVKQRSARPRGSGEDNGRR